MKGKIIDVKQFGAWLIISYEADFGIAFEKLRIDRGKINEN